MSAETQGEQTEQQLWDSVLQEREGADEAPEQTGDDKTAATTEEAAETTAAAGEGEAKAEQPAAAAEPDPYEGLSPALKARLAKLDALEQQVQQIPTLIQHVRTAEGRVAAMQREVAESKTARESVTTKEAPSDKQIAAAAVSAEKWDKLKDDFPEWAEATEQFVQAKLAGLTPQQAQGLAPEKVEELVNAAMQKERATFARQLEFAKVEGKHADWQETVRTTDFQTWFAMQAPEVQMLAQSEAARDAIRMLDLFTEAKAKPATEVKQERANKLAAAVNEKPGTSAAAVKTVDQMSPSELWEYERRLALKRRSSSGLTY